MNESDPTRAAHAGANTGLKRRYQFSKESGIIEVAGLIFCDVFFSKRLLLNYVDLKVVKTTSRHEFCLTSSVVNTDFKAKFIAANLKVRKVKINLSVSFAQKRSSSLPQWRSQRICDARA